MPNHDKDGVPYGVASLHGLAEWVYDEFVEYGENLTFNAVVEDFLHTWDVENPGRSEEREDAREEALERFLDEVYLEEEEYRLEKDGMTLGLSYLGGAPLVWVLDSPYTAIARPCSPCCPGAGDLDSRDESGIRCLSLPPEWFLTD